VLCDFSLPRFNALKALDVLQRKGVEIPLILVSGAIGDEEAAAAIRAGARDFVKKTNLARLAPAVERELREAVERRARRQAERAYRDLIEQSMLGIVVFQDERVILANQAMAEMLGMSVEEMTSAGPGAIVDAIRPEFRDEMWSRLRNHLADTASPTANEFRLDRRDGSSAWVVASESKVQLNDRPAVQLAFVDITLRRQLEEALARGKEEWERTFDTVSEHIFMTDRALRIKRLNRAPCDRLGVHPRSLLGKPAAEVFGCPAETIPIDRLRAGESVEIDIDSEPLGGLLRFSISPFLNADAELEGAVLVGRDITVQRHLEELERRQITVDQAEHIFRTFRHETGNALNALKTTLSVFRSGFDEFDKKKTHEYFSRCFEALRIAEQLLFAVRRYQTLDDVRLQELQLDGFIHQKADLLFERARLSGISCVVGGSAEELTVAADPDAMLRVLLNLVENATAALEGRDSPRIDVRMTKRKDEAVVEVRDNGCGIPHEVQSRVFSPLFSTKAEGMGMGLAVVQKLMVRMHGLASLQSATDEGTTVTLSLPLSSLTPEGSASDRSPRMENDLSATGGRD
jgi:PAS domain S-box-containing protein